MQSQFESKCTGNEHHSVQLLDTIKQIATSDLFMDKSDLYKKIPELFEKGADPNVTDSEGKSCLDYLMEEPWSEKSIYRTFDSYSKAWPNLVDGEKTSRLFYEKKWFRGSYEITIFRAEALPEIARNYPEMEDMTNIREVDNPYEKCFDIARQLIEAGMNVDATNLHGSTILHMACECCNVEMVKYLLSRGASLTNVDERGHSALLLAIESQNMELVRFFVEAGADIHHLHRIELKFRREFQMVTPLQAAVKTRNIEIVEYILNCGADPNQTNEIIFTALRYNAGIPILELLLAHGADINEDDHNTNSQSYFEFLVSSSYGGFGVPEIRLLIEHGLDIGKCIPTYTWDFSPLHVAIEKDSKSAEMLSFLLECKTKHFFYIEHVDKNGHTPLCIAMKKGHANCVKLLLKHGANVNHVDLKGRTPLEIGVGNVGLLEIECIQYLMDAGAEIGNSLKQLVVPCSSSDQYDSIHDHFYRSLQLEFDQERLVRAQCIIKYRVLYESRFSSVAKPINLQNVGECTDLCEYYNDCMTEIGLLKSSILNNSISYHSVLTADEDFYKLVRNDAVFEEFDDENLSDRFPLYGKDLIKRFKDQKTMHDIWEKAVKNLSQCLKLDSRVYYSIIHWILEYLCEKDLMSFAESY